jgi:hypothetical protein
MKLIKHICYHLYRGSFCDLPTFGTHPGLGMIIILMGSLTLVAGGPGLLVSSLVFLPIFLWGSYSRSVGDPEDVSPAVVEVTATQIVTDLLANPYPHDLMSIRREVERVYGRDNEEAARAEMDAYCTQDALLEARRKWVDAQDAAREWLSSQQTIT